MYELEQAIEQDQLAFKNNISSSIDTTRTATTKDVHPLIGLDGKELKSLYQCDIIKIPKYFDGTKSLKNVNVGDVVHILKEFVGPDSNYHLCRIEKKIIDGDNDKTKKEGDDKNAEDKHKAFIQRLDATYNYGWFPVTCLKKI